MGKKLPSTPDGRGRPKTDLTTELKATVDKIIALYREQVQPRGLISYNSIYKFAEELYETKQIEYRLKEHFWKKGHGRDLIDKANKVIQVVATNKEQSDKNKIVDTVDAVDKLFTGKAVDKRKLIASLKRNEDNLLRFQNENEKLQKRLEKTKAEIQELKEKNKTKSETIKELESLFFSWLEASDDGNNSLVNLISTGQSRTSVVDEFFKSAFSDPKTGFSKFEEFRNSTTKTDNIVSFSEKKKDKTVLDDFSF